MGATRMKTERERERDIAVFTAQVTTFAAEEREL
jgi:hypothetical protein